jgi:hypothetical protein
MNCFLPAFGIVLVLSAPAPAQWPGFRGPNLDGISTERGLPLKWGPQENLFWKLKLPGPGSSSPIVVGQRVLVTCWSGYGVPGTTKQDLPKLKRHLLCVDRSSGKVLWEKTIPARQPESPYSSQIAEHGYTTSTPVSDGQRIYVFFGATGVFAFDLDGNQLWHADVGSYLNNFGSAGSPVLHQNLLIVNATVEKGALFALDKTSGKEVWRTKVYGDCWSTPIVVSLPSGKFEVVLNGLNHLMGFDPGSGKELWRCEQVASAYSSSTPLIRDGIVYVMGAGADGRWFQAVRAGGQGDVSKSHVVWSHKKAGASYCSPLLIGDRLYYFSALATCLKAVDGDLVYQERLAALGTEYSSPVLADGRVYLFTRRKGGYVLAMKDKPEVISHNDLGDTTDFNASPAIAGGNLFIRSQQYLYCIGEKR